jgi:diguanylate cyclase (GGDEF)-like protein
VCVHPCPIVQELLPTRRASRTPGRASTHPDMVARRADGGRIGLNVLAMGASVDGVPMMLHFLRPEARSDRDPLTAALSREAFIVRALEEQSRALRTGSTLALALVEVDDLEAINDSLGFSTGDRLLLAVADSLRVGRSAGLVGRWGGDQFALLLPDMTDVEATQRLRWTLGLLERSVTVDGRTATVSAGIVQVNPHAALTAAFAAADEAIARARRH